MEIESTVILGQMELILLSYWDKWNWANCHIETNGIDSTVLLTQLSLCQLSLCQLSYWVNCRWANSRWANCRFARCRGIHLIHTVASKVSIFFLPSLYHLEAIQILLHTTSLPAKMLLLYPYLLLWNSDWLPILLTT